MNSDFVSMIENLSQSLLPVQGLLTGAAYLVGILFMITAISKLRKIGDAKTSGGSQERMFVPIAYILSGSALIFLPSALEVLSNTAFGSGNILRYTNFNPYNVYSAIRVIIQTAGIIWFFRGCVLLAHASQPGVDDGPKGLLFLVAGILAMNFQGTIGILNDSLNYLMSLGTSVTSPSS